MQASPDNYLRSINIQMDASSPDRIAHFQPTSKAIRLIRALYEGDGANAWLVSAPYGTGKSLAATYTLQLVENRRAGGKSLLGITERLADLDGTLGEDLKTRLRSKKKGMVLALHGHVESLPEAIQAAAAESFNRLGMGRHAGAVKRRPCATIEDAIALLKSLRGKSKDTGLDRLMLVWDEFGRHLEALVSTGRPAELLEIQQLAEYASRTSAPAFCVALLLHQGITSYAGSLPESARREWAKIEGRFEKLEYVDDSREIIQLIAALMKAGPERRNSLAPPKKKTVADRAHRARELGFFSEFNHKEVVTLAQDVWPLSLAALCVLPRVAARLAQNERTLFSFLMSIPGDEEVGLDSLYRFFEPVMRADTAPGGTYRQWLETQSATAKVDRDEHVSILQACSILSLGLSGERSRVSKAILEFGATPMGASGPAKTARSIRQLIDRKLLLHRVHSDVVSLWHGTDVDLRSRLNDAKDRFRAGFDVRGFLERECPPPLWRPVRYNDENWIRRYVEPEYQFASEFMAEASFSALLGDIPANVDLKLIYLLPQGREELESAKTVGKKLTKKKEMRRLIVAIPKGIADLTDACLEVWSLMQLELDEELVGSDPLVLEELRQMEEDARGRLLLLVDRVIQPNPDLAWFWRGEGVTHHSTRELREWLSDVTGKIYDKSPRFRSEVINRKKPSAVVINARKKLTGAIFELSGEPALGFGDERFGQEYSAAVEGIYRAVLENTHLYGEGDNQRWGYLAPPALASDKGLEAVWRMLQRFFTEPTERHPRSFEDLITQLQLPPHGVRAGVIPILIAAASRAFPTAGAITRDGDYVEDLKPSDLEELCKAPERFKLNVVALDEDQVHYLEGVYDIFSAGSKYTIDRTDLISACVESIAVWKEHLPKASRTSRRVESSASQMREHLFRKGDPLRLLLHDLPVTLSGDPPNYKQVLTQLAASKRELEAVVEEYYSAVTRVLANAILGTSVDIGGGEIQATFGAWANCFPPELVDLIANPRAKPLIARLGGTYRSDHKYLNAIATVTHGRKIEDWADSDLAQFEQSLRGAVRDIEEAALQPPEDVSLTAEANPDIADILERRIAGLVPSMERLVGADASKAALASMLDRDPAPPHGRT